MKIIFSGGGTLGSVTPLLAIHEILQEKYPEASFIWVGTKHGPEKQLVEKKNIPFVGFSSSKLRRYISFWNLVDIFKLFISFSRSLRFMQKEKPDLCISVGGFVSVPLHWAAWFFNVPTWIHQQDVRIGLANKLMAPCASIITTALEQNLKNFSNKKTIWLGNPLRRDILQGDKFRAQTTFKLKGEQSVVFVTGGGTGSENINQFVAESVGPLKGVCEIIHLLGKKRPHEIINKISSQFEHYHTYDFFREEMKDAYAAADIVVSRGGFGTLSEIAALEKAAIIIPKSGHQEENVKFLSDAKAIVLLDERVGSGVKLAGLIKELLGDPERVKIMKNNLKKILPIAKKEEIVNIVEKIIK